MQVSTDPGDVLVTHALGSCIGVTLYDRMRPVGAMLHVMLPDSQINADKARSNPWMFVDTALPALFHAAYEAGALKNRLVVKVAGGANVQGGEKDTFAIGKRNYLMLKKILWKNGVLIEREDVGGSHARTMYLDIGSGRVTLATNGVETEL
jgi:chemotaxis protein CheD